MYIGIMNKKLLKKIGIIGLLIITPGSFITIPVYLYFKYKKDKKMKDTQIRGP